MYLRIASEGERRWLAMLERCERYSRNGIDLRLAKIAEAKQIIAHLEALELANDGLA